MLTIGFMNLQWHYSVLNVTLNIEKNLHLQAFIREVMFEYHHITQWKMAQGRPGA